MRPISATSRGFTLIEILVVIAIISLLSSVLLAGTAAARAKARDARTETEVAEARTALESYRAEHGGYPVCNPGGSFPQTCCLGSASCKLAGASINDKLPATEVPNFGDTTPLYRDAEGNEYQGYAYTCGSAEPGSDGQLCADDETYITYPLSTGIESIEPDGTIVESGTTPNGNGSNPPNPVAGTGSRCDTNAYPGTGCPTGLVCDGNIRCTLPVGSGVGPAGTWCDHYLQCQDGMVCSELTCAPAPLPGIRTSGSGCGGEYGNCNPGLTCQDGTCRVPLGANCLQNSSCPNGSICSDASGTCVAQ